MTDVRTRATLVAAALIGAFLLVQNVIGTVSGLAYGYTPGIFTAQAGSTTFEFFTRIVPVAVGVFLVFWRFLAPITSTLTLTQVLLRSLVATAAGTVAAAVVGGVVALLSAAGGLLFGNAFPFGAVGSVFNSFGTWFSSLITGYVGLAPLVALAAVLLWLWLRGRTG
jgi:hypothetical protein